MAHIKSLGAARFADLSMSLLTTATAAETGSLEVTYSGLETVISKFATTTTGSGLNGSNNTPLGQALTDVGVAAGAGQLLFSSEVSEITAAPVTATSPKYIRIRHIKEFPTIGTPANIVKVPNYGKKNSIQIQGQADAPTMELTLNYIPALWADGNVYSGTDALNYKTFAKVGDGRVYIFRFTLLDAKPEGYDAEVDASNDQDSITGDGATIAPFGTIENTSYYFLGKMEALEVTPSLTDAITAKLTIAVQSEVYGAFTVNA
jgi:hypothetical protein